MPLAINFAACLGTRSALRLISDAFALDYMSRMFWNDPAGAVKGVALFVPFLFYQFPFFGFAAVGAGMVKAWKDNRRFAISIILSTCAVVLLTSTYMPQRRAMILSPVFALLAVTASFGFSSIIEWMKCRLHARWVAAVLFAAVAVTPVAIYLAAPVVAEKTAKGAIPIRSLPHRDNLAYFLRPWKNGENGPEIFAMRAFKTAGEGIIIADSTPMRVLSYYRQYGAMNAPSSQLVPLEGIDLKEYLEKRVNQNDIFMVENPDFLE